MLTPEIRAISCSSWSGLSTLALLVTGVGTDHEHPAVAADDLALLAHRLDRGSYLHVDPLSVIENILHLNLDLALATGAVAATTQRGTRKRRSGPTHPRAAGAPGDGSRG